MTPTYHTLNWNGYTVEAEAYIDFGGMVEFESIRVLNDKGEEIDTIELLGILTPVNRTTHVKCPINELSQLFQEAEREYIMSMENPITL